MMIATGKTGFIGSESTTWAGLASSGVEVEEFALGASDKSSEDYIEYL